MESSEVSRRKALAAGTSSRASAAAPARPNILWLVSEDNNPFLGAYGDPLARTPTLDRLAREGVRYANAFSTAPVCAPTRFAILTGVPAESCGPAQNMRAEGNIPAFLRGYPEYLREAGYFCTNREKTDYNAPFDPAKVWDLSGPFAHWRRRPKGKPFLSVFNSRTTHEGWLIYSTADRTRPEDVQRYPFRPTQVLDSIADLVDRVPEWAAGPA